MAFVSTSKTVKDYRMVIDRLIREGLEMGDPDRWPANPKFFQLYARRMSEQTGQDIGPEDYEKLSNWTIYVAHKGYYKSRSSKPKGWSEEVEMTENEMSHLWEMYDKQKWFIDSLGFSPEIHKMTEEMNDKFN